MSERGYGRFWLTENKDRRMPRRYGDLWDRVVAFDNIERSYRAAAKNKRYRNDVLKYAANLEENIINTQNLLVWHQWKPGPMRSFWVNDPKPRFIQAPPFSDRVVHHALVSVVEPVFERKMIEDSYACRKGKGVHAARRRAQEYIRMAKREWGKVYVLKADISKYFPSINHDVLFRMFTRTIKDRNVLWLARQIIYKSGYKNRGIPVGALTSQLEANIYLTLFDHWIKDELGIRYYVRYMDDFMILSRSKSILRELLHEIEAYLVVELSLALNPKTTIVPARGVDFCGYRIWPTHTLPRKRNLKKVRRRFRAMSNMYASGRVDLNYVHARVASFLGYMKYCDGYRTTKSVLDELVLKRG